jgi:hypothetical protein
MSQSATITTPPFLNMANTSFTFESWMYAQTLCNGTSCTDNAIIGQSQAIGTDHSLQLIVRNQRIWLGFFDDDAVGSTVSKE